jgi:hypothetical protein
MKYRMLLSAGLAGALCVDVKIDQVAYLNCLNEMFRATAPPARPGEQPNAATIAAPAAGIYDQAAIREMLGQSFGRSVLPQRPPNPLPR